MKNIIEFNDKILLEVVFITSPLSAGCADVEKTCDVCSQFSEFMNVEILI